LSKMPLLLILAYHFHRHLLNLNQHLNSYNLLIKL
jgi:hypothetical protein